MIALVAAVLLLPAEPTREPLHHIPSPCLEFWERWDAAAALNNEEELDRLLTIGEATQCDVHGLLGEGVYEGD